MNQSLNDQPNTSANSSMLLLDSINTVATSQAQSHSPQQQSPHRQSNQLITTAVPYISSSPCVVNNNQHQHVADSLSCFDRLADDDTEIIELCQRLFEQTFDQSQQHQQIKRIQTSPNMHLLDNDEFTQVGIRKCVKFCMNLPGNNDLCTDDRAKLLKYGVYEIVVSFGFFLSRLELIQRRLI